MPTYEITAPDGKTYDVTAPEGASQRDVLAYAQQHYATASAPVQAAPAKAPTGPQPSFMDRVVASPVGRFAHDAIVQPIMGMGEMLSKLDPTAPDQAKVSAMMEKPYQGALARNRNTPGYAAARSEAEARLARQNPINAGSGLTDQLTAPFNPAMAGLGGLLTGGLDQSNAAADAQTASQSAYQARHPALSLGAGVIGGAGSPAGAMTNAMLAVPKVKVPSIGELRDAAKASYSAVDNSGVRVSNDALNRLGDSIQDSFGSRLDPVLHPDASAAFRRISQYATDGEKGGHVATFSDLDNLRRVVADAAQSTKPADKAMARMMMDRIDDFVGNLKVNDLDTSLQDALRSDLMQATSAKGQLAKQIKTIEQTKPGALAARGAAGADTRAKYMQLRDQLPEAEAARQNALAGFQAETDLINAGPQATIDSLKHAREMWARASQADMIQKQIDKAAIQASANFSQSGFENALRQRFKSLALNDKAMSRLSPDVQKAVKDVAKGSPVGNVMRAIGKYAPHGPVATAAGMGVGAMMGGMTGAAEGGLASILVPAVGEAARHGATLRTVGAANRARDIAAIGNSAAIPAQPLLQRPRLPSNPIMPLGLPLLLAQSAQTQ